MKQERFIVVVTGTEWTQARLDGTGLTQIFVPHLYLIFIVYSQISTQIQRFVVYFRISVQRLTFVCLSFYFFKSYLAQHNGSNVNTVTKQNTVCIDLKLFIGKKG